MDAVLAILCVLFAYGALCLGVFILGAFLGGSPEFNGAVAVALPLGILLFISKRIESRVGMITKHYRGHAHHLLRLSSHVLAHVARHLNVHLFAV